MPFDRLAVPIEHLAVGEDVRLGVQPALGVDPDLEPLLLDELHKGLDDSLALVGLVHRFQGGGDVLGRFGDRLLRFRAFSETLAFELIRHEFQTPRALGQLLQRLAVGRVADKQAEFFHAGQLIGDAGQSRDEEVSDGKSGRFCRSQDAVDVVAKLLVAVVDNVVSWHGRSISCGKDLRDNLAQHDNRVVIWM